MTCPSVADDILLNIYRYGSVPSEGSNLHCNVGTLRVASALVAALGRCTQRPYHASAIDSVLLFRLGHRGLAGVHLPCAQGGGEGVGVGVVLLHANGHAQNLVGVLGGLLHFKGLYGSLHHENAVLLGGNAIGGACGILLQDSEPLVEIGCGTCIETYTGEDGTK